MILLIYLIGVLVILAIAIIQERIGYIRSFTRGIPYKFTLVDLISTIFLSATSWIYFIVLLILSFLEYLDKTRLSNIKIIEGRKIYNTAWS